MQVGEMYCYLKEAQIPINSDIREFISSSELNSKYIVYLLPKDDIDSLQYVYMMYRWDDEGVDIPFSVTHSVMDTRVAVNCVVYDLNDIIIKRAKMYDLKESYIISDGKVYEYYDWDCGNEVPDSRPPSLSISGIVETIPPDGFLTGVGLIANT